MAGSGADPRHIPSLDGLRAVSILLVFLAHAGLEDVVPGGLGVTIFFFLSGFLITTLMRAEYDHNGSVNLKHFWLRRALRILPPFYLVLALAYGGAAILAPDRLSLSSLVAQVLHATNYWIIYRGEQGLPPSSGVGVYWSLAVEEHFYLLFPLLYVAFRKAGLSSSRQARALWAICALVLAWRAVLVIALHAPLNRTYMASDTRLDSILFGCALAVWGNPVLDRAWVDERTLKRFVVPLALLLLAFTLLYRDEVFRESARYTLQGVALTPLFVAAVRFPRWGLLRVLNWRPVAFVGVLSYSFYLVHFGAIFVTLDLLPALHPVVRGVLAFFLGLGVSWLIYLFVERPCARLRRRLTD